MQQRSNRNTIAYRSARFSQARTLTNIMNIIRTCLQFQQEYARSVRKHIRSWRKQGSPAPVGDNTVHTPAQPWEQKNRGGTPVLSGTGQSATRPAKLTSTGQGNANVNWSPSNSVGAACTLEEREDAAEMTGISAWTRHEAAGRVETISPKLTAVIDRSYLVSSDVGVEGGDVAGRDSREQPRGGRLVWRVG